LKNQRAWRKSKGLPYARFQNCRMTDYNAAKKTKSPPKMKEKKGFFSNTSKPGGKQMNFLFQLATKKIKTTLN